VTPCVLSLFLPRYVCLNRLFEFDGCSAAFAFFLLNCKWSTAKFKSCATRVIIREVVTTYWWAALSTLITYLAFAFANWQCLWTHTRTLLVILVVRTHAWSGCSTVLYGDAVIRRHNINVLLLIMCCSSSVEMVKVHCGKTNCTNFMYGNNFLFAFSANTLLESWMTGACTVLTIFEFGGYCHSRKKSTAKFKRRAPWYGAWLLSV